MLKSGQVVALDTTANLLARYGKTRGPDGQETDLEDVFMQIMAGGQQ
jgi:ABC-2 type transport system ATP-binding protein